MHLYINGWSLSFPSLTSCKMASGLWFPLITSNVSPSILDSANSSLALYQFWIKKLCKESNKYENLQNSYYYYSNTIQDHNIYYTWFLWIQWHITCSTSSSLKGLANEQCCRTVVHYTVYIHHTVESYWYSSTVIDSSCYNTKCLDKVNDSTQSFQG